MISTFIQLCFVYLIFILCTAPQNSDPILRRMREQHASDSENEHDVFEDVARQYFIYSISVKFSPCRTTSLILYVISRAVDFCSRDP